MPPTKGQKGNWKGRSGRRSLSVEVERCKIRDAAWRVTGEFITSDADLKDRADRAVRIVTADMAKPIIVDQSQHTHITSVQVENLSADQLMDFVMGKNNGRSDIRQSA